MNNKLPQISCIFDRRKVATPTTLSSVEIRITYNYKQKYLATGIKLYSTQWKNGKIVNHPDIMQISQILDKLLSKVRQVILSMMDEGHIDINSISERLGRLEREDITFLDYCKQRAVIRKYGKRKDTQERYDRFLKRFSSWGSIREFRDITEENIIAYDKYLAKQDMKPYSKWQNYHRFLKSFISDAIEEGYLHKNPYKWLNIESKEDSSGIDKYLTPEEFRMIKVAKMPTESLSRVRDVFVFQTYTCLRYSDLKAFDARYVQEIKGMKM